jgi:L-fuculose-phosphate aldolase
MARGEARQDVADCYRYLVRLGLMGTFGHVSARVPGQTDIVFITPIGSGIPGEMQAGDILTITLDGQKVDGEGRVPPEVPMHTWVHRVRDDAEVVVHSHALMATIVGISGTRLIPISQHGAVCGDGLPVYDDASMITTEEQGREMAEALGLVAKGLVLRGHGIVAVGASIREALVNTFAIEDNAVKLLFASLLGEPRRLRADEMERLRRITLTPLLFDHFWNYQKRLDRMDLRGHPSRER